MKYLELLKKNWQVMLLALIPCILAILRVDFLMIVAVEVWLAVTLCSVNNFSENIFFTVFLCSFFVFLISGDLAEQIFHVYYYRRFNADAVTHSRICIILSLAFLGLGFRSKKTLWKKMCIEEKIAGKIGGIRESVNFVSKAILCVTFPILLIDTINTVIFVAMNGYVAYYSSYNPLLPSVVIKVGEMTHAVLCVYLATFPKKKETKIILLLYLVFSVLAMAIGQRGAFIYRFAFILAYLFLRQKVHNDGEVWIKKRTIIALAISAPFLLAFLFAYGYIRMGNDVPDQSIGELIAGFFVNIGSTSQILKDGYVYDLAIPRTKLFSVGGIIQYFRYGTLFNLFSQNAVPTPHTAEFALEGNRFDHFLSYLTIPERYFGGEGTGSCFIAELFADFGYLGVCFGSYIYGKFFKTLSELKNRNWLSASVLLYMMMQMVKTPRGAYDDFLTAIINVVYIASITMVTVVAWMHHKGVFDPLLEKVRKIVIRKE